MRSNALSHDWQETKPIRMGNLGRGGTTPRQSLPFRAPPLRNLRAPSPHVVAEEKAFTISSDTDRRTAEEQGTVLLHVKQEPCDSKETTADDCSTSTVSATQIGSATVDDEEDATRCATQSMMNFEDTGNHHRQDEINLAQSSSWTNLSYPHQHLSPEHGNDDISATDNRQKFTKDELRFLRARMPDNHRPSAEECRRLADLIGCHPQRIQLYQTERRHRARSKLDKETRRLQEIQKARTEAFAQGHETGFARGYMAAMSHVQRQQTSTGYQLIGPGTMLQVGPQHFANPSTLSVVPNIPPLQPAIAYIRHDQRGNHAQSMIATTSQAPANGNNL